MSDALTNAEKHVMSNVACAYFPAIHKHFSTSIQFELNDMHYAVT